MANDTAPQQSVSRKHTGLFRWIAIFLLTLIVIVGIVVLIVWLIIKPKRLVYTIEDASVHNFNLYNNHLNSTFNFVIRAHNPNGRASIYYDSIEVSVAYDDQSIAFNTLEPFRQPTRNVSRLEAKLVSQNVALSNSISQDLKLEKSAGEVELDVHIKAKIRFKVGVWKSDHRTLRVVCSPVMVHFSSSKSFQRADCDIDL
ncbi:putative Late embryogenesis abundant (LEA) hydroxyproline-rich glycoprotein family [Melia azedarach]|uniref:Late embryogenesis abundant (LEA) hydroxyproline-rich glycoprotein family n=1 Tax=Melia azedarach TaxID=155640 RepID=A0ACC1YP68_MELAZ|nr:putative Late embryogenesis abundant (LEA) hydroxyproline-rich glycoprotein family [Melia azedarach]